MDDSASLPIKPADNGLTKKPIISEIELAYRLFRRPEAIYTPKLVAVTGTNGKSTVVTMIGNALNCPVLGNIGVPLIDYVDHPDRPEWIVVELSSYQLATCQHFRPEVAVVLNITLDHLQWHQTMENYAAAKLLITQAQDPTDYLIYNTDDPLVSGIAEKTNAKKWPCPAEDKAFLVLSRLPLFGKHNRLNAYAAYLACKAALPQAEGIIDKITQTPALPHRLEHVAEIDGRCFINDSKSTTPDSTIKAVESFQGPVHLILCGKDKDLPLEELMRGLENHVETVTIWGDIKNRFVQEAKDSGVSYPLIEALDLEDAIQKTVEASARSSTILFSPSCASFDAFKSFEHRGEAFRQLIQKRKGQ